MKVGIIQYNAGNIQSMQFALKRLGVTPVLSSNPAELAAMDRLIFPGVGEASSAMQFLKQRELDHLIVTYQRPLLGICLGLQLLCEFSEENNTPALGIFPITVRRFPPEGKVPHIGWNTISPNENTLWQGVPSPAYTYFVHSYYAPLSEFTIARSEYLVPFSAALLKDNYVAVQFHPEKSGEVGERILRNFLEWNP